MFLADYHTHSLYSSDGHDGFAELLDAAQKAGLDELCVTDHCDMGAAEPFPAEERHGAFEPIRAGNRTGVKLLLGIELGEPIFDLARAEAALAQAPYDFVIGSHHALKGERDFYYMRYASEEDFHRMMPRYFAELREMAEWGRFDVLGHIEYPLRYTGRDGFTVPSLLPRYEDELRDLFRFFAHKGLGVEVNFRKSGIKPDPAVYALYRQCGGESITIGSDAHRAADVGRGLTDGLELCRAAGFTHMAAFEQRRVRYEKI
ncbi:MAG: PHP domain-containing protein [Oscillospiraceae bacterium]|nr:PHP domain-containing protein [Oscillospiraceae bacterium]